MLIAMIVLLLYAGMGGVMYRRCITQAAGFDLTAYTGLTVAVGVMGGLFAGVLVWATEHTFYAAWVVMVTVMIMRTLCSVWIARHHAPVDTKGAVNVILLEVYIGAVMGGLMLLWVTFSGA